MAQRPEVNWWQQLPPVLWPVPIRDAPSLLGRDVDLIGARVIVGESGSGFWSYEQRAVTKIHQVGGQDCIGIVPEFDWYRTQRDNTYVAVPRSVLATRVWIELAMPMDHRAAPIPPDQSDLPPECRAASLVEQPGQPKVRWPRPASEQTAVTGARCWFLSPDGAQAGYRALGEPRRREVGTIDMTRGLDGLDTPFVSTVIPLYAEQDWYRWQDTGSSEDTVQVIVESQLVFLE